MMEKLKNSKYIRIAILILVVVALIIYFLSKGKMPQAPSGPAGYIKTTEDIATKIVPNKSFLNTSIDSPTIQGQMKKLNQVETGNATHTHYEGYFKDKPLRIDLFVDKTGKVGYIKVGPNSLETSNFDNIKKLLSLGNPETERYATEGDFEVMLYAYPSKGWAFEVNPYNKEVYEIIYFEPTSESEFLSAFGDRYTQNSSQTGY